ncbi:MAG: hypothetical protein IJW78_04780 [Clostridia bacterium]|nr:hypothetical protein [Clostridia bacterium]
MSVTEKYLNKTRKQVVIPAYSTVTVEYNDSMPNYYRVTNMGDSRLYCGTSSMPTVKRHEFTVGAHKIKLYAEPSRRNNLYIYNPSGTDVECIVFSFEAEFDPATLALADLEIDVSGQTIESRSVITGFEQPLPSGSNKIGSVDITGNAGTNISNIFSRFSTLLKNATVSGYTNLFDVVKAIKEVKTSVEASAGVVSGFPLADTKTAASTVSYDNVTSIGMITNDGENDLSLEWSAGTKSGAMAVKPGETLADMKFPSAATVTVKYAVAGETVAYRMVYTIAE